jgi:signal transduction histidine kinase
LTAVQNMLAKRGQAGFPVGETKAGQSLESPVAAPSFSGWEDKANQAIKILSHELERKNEELNELDRLKSKFVATVSHELRTPLTIIDGAVSQVVSEIYGKVNEEQRKKLTMALRASERLRGMIDELLDFAKLEARKVTLQKERVDLVEIAREIHASFYPLLHEKGVELVTQCSHPVIVLSADRNRVIQIFMNLLGNAKKFTSTGKIEVRVNDFNDRVECSVSDTGRGIAAADLPKVFGRFQQFGEGAHTSGTGLGLSITKEIVELHGGTITVESEAGKGTTFKFVLPKH